MSDAERIKFWTQHAISSEADRVYLAACAQAQISMALSLERIAEALEKTQWGKGLEPLLERQMFAERFNAPNHRLTASPVGDVRAAALEIEENIAYLEDKAAQRSIVDDLSAIMAKHLFPVKEATPPDPVAADPFDCLCGQCGIEFKAPLHDEKYGSHKFEPSPYKTLKEWRKANNASQVLRDVE